DDRDAQVEVPALGLLAVLRHPQRAALRLQAGALEPAGRERDARRPGRRLAAGAGGGDEEREQAGHGLRRITHAARVRKRAGGARASKIPGVEVLERIQAWHKAQCERGRDLSLGVQIHTLVDQPGWSVRIDLAGTPLSGLTLAPYREGATDRDW